MNWVFDLDGVVYRGLEPIAGSPTTIEALITEGESVTFVTNNSWSPRSVVEDKLGGMGISAEGRVYTSASAAGDLLTPGERVVVLGGPGIVEAVNEADCVVVNPDVESVTDGVPPDVVIAGLDKTLSYERLCGAAVAIRNGARFIATNEDVTYPAAGGLLLPGAGSLIAALVAATGQTPVFAGKPCSPAVNGLRRRLNGPGIMIGDRPNTDGMFARALGFEFGLVLSGVTEEADLPVDPEPDYIGADVAELVSRRLSV